MRDRGEAEGEAGNTGRAYLASRQRCICGHPLQFASNYYHTDYCRSACFTSEVCLWKIGAYVATTGKSGTVVRLAREVA